MRTFDKRGRSGRRRGLTAVLAVGTLLLTAGCGGSSGSGDRGTNASPDDFDPNGVLKVGVNFGQVTVVDPNDDMGLPAPAAYWSDLIYGTLLGEGETLDQSTPAMITEWETPDDNTIKLTLRDDLKFSDGTPFNAEAVKFSWDRCKADDGFKLDLFLAMESVTADDETHVTVNLSLPYAGVWVNFLLRSAIYCMPIVSPTAVEKEGDNFKNAPVGAGPYMVESIAEGQKIVLVPNPEYPLKDEQTFSRIEFVQVAPGPATVTALTSGQIDMAAVTPSQFDALEGRNFTVAKAPGSIVTHLSTCSQKGPMADPDARAAVKRAINAEEINDAVYKGQFVVDRQIVPDFHPFYSDYGAEENSFDVEAAKKLADSSGLTGQTIDLMFYSVSPEQATTSELIKSQLAAIDVTVNLIPTQNPFADKLAQQPDLDLWGWFPESIPTTLGPGQINNTCGLDDPELTEALKSIFRADPTAAKEAWDEVQRIVSDKTYAMPLISSVTAWAYSDKVIGDFVIPKNGFWGVDWEKIGKAKA